MHKPLTEAETEILEEITNEVKAGADGKGTMDPGQVVFASCGECGTNILRSQKRKREGENWYHADCLPKESVQGAPGPGPGAGAEDGAQAIADILAKHMKVRGEIDEKKILSLIEEKFRELAEGLPKPKVIEVRREGESQGRKLAGIHKDFEKLLYLASKRHHAYLWGPPGSGKSTAAKQTSEALGLRYGYTSLNPQTPESRLIGYMDAGGSYRETVFYQLYKSGGVFCIDEQDNASPALLTTLNSLLENGCGAFPCGIVERHPDFVLVSCGNTPGRGASQAFPDRRPFDCAFAERFTFLYWDIDADLELSVALSISKSAEPWVNYIRRLRKYCQRTCPKVVISPRASFKGANYLQDGTFTVLEILENVVFKGLDRDTVENILAENKIPKEITVEKPKKRA